MLYVKIESFDEIIVMGNEQDCGMFIPISDDNVYAVCERCDEIDRLENPCQFIAKSSDTRATFKDEYELCDKCTEDVRILKKYLGKENSLIEK